MAAYESASEIVPISVPLHLTLTYVKLPSFAVTLALVILASDLILHPQKIQIAHRAR